MRELTASQVCIVKNQAGVACNHMAHVIEKDVRDGASMHDAVLNAISPALERNVSISNDNETLKMALMQIASMPEVRMDECAHIARVAISNLTKQIDVYEDKSHYFGEDYK